MYFFSFSKMSLKQKMSQENPTDIIEGTKGEREWWNTVCCPLVLLPCIMYMIFLVKSITNPLLWFRFHFLFWITCEINWILKIEKNVYTFSGSGNGVMEGDREELCMNNNYKCVFEKEPCQKSMLYKTFKVSPQPQDNFSHIHTRYMPLILSLRLHFAMSSII